MLREEAIKDIRTVFVKDYADKIIKALEQEPSCPYYVIDEDGHGLCKNHRLEQEPSGETVSLEAFKQVMWERDIAIEQLKELGYDFGQKIEPCDYTISHDAVLQAVSEGCQELRGVYGRCEELINNLPPIPQPCGDAINRQAVIDIIHKTIYDFFDVCGDDEEVPISDKDKLLLKVNKAICNNIKALEQEPCDDAISRQAVLDIVDGYSESQSNVEDVTQDIISDILVLSPIKQEPKIGHWEYVQYDYNPRLGNWHCSECRCVVIECVDKNEKGGIPLYNYCPNCGAKMIEPQAESEVEKCI